MDHVIGGEAATGHSSGGDAARLQSLLDLAKVVGAVRSFDDFVELTAEEARRALDACSLSVSRWEREEGQLRTLVNVGQLAPGQGRFPRDEVYVLTADAVAGSELVEGGPGYLVTSDEASPGGSLLARLDRASALFVPILVEGRVWGEMFATRSHGQRRFAPDDLDFARAVAAQVAAGIVQADHYARIERLAFQDPLTGLANRRAIDERLESLMAEHVRDRAPVSLILADINRLKQVNDSFGHGAGDRLIAAVGDAASRASALVPKSLAARIGGDEFCIVVADAPAELAVEVADLLCALVEALPMSTVVQENHTEPGTDRRSRRGRLALDAAALLESGVDILDHLRDSHAQTRVEAIADHVLMLVDAAAWWVSFQPRGTRTLVGVSSSVQRFGEGSPDAGVETGGVGAVFSLDDLPATDAALREGQAFRVDLRGPDNDPAAEAALVSAGYSGVLAAGVTGPEGGWVVEIYTDSISLPLAGFEPVLRSLVALAVTGASPGRPTQRDVRSPVRGTVTVDLRDDAAPATTPAARPVTAELNER
jgi:diguanylate cyclase (GGDEF)-like protein